MPGDELEPVQRLASLNINADGRLPLKNASKVYHIREASAEEYGVIFFHMVLTMIFPYQCVHFENFLNMNIIRIYNKWMIFEGKEFSRAKLYLNHLNSLINITEKINYSKFSTFIIIFSKITLTKMNSFSSGSYKAMFHLSITFFAFWGGVGFLFGFAFSITNVTPSESVDVTSLW